MKLLRRSFSLATATKRNSINLEKGKVINLKEYFFFEGRFPAIHFGCMPPEKTNLLKEAAEVAKNADAVILIAGTNLDWETEGMIGLTSASQQIKIY